jgi:hypothetical protein
MAGFTLFGVLFVFVIVPQRSCKQLGTKKKEKGQKKGTCSLHLKGRQKQGEEWDLHLEVLLSESLDRTATLSHALTAAEEMSLL